MPNGIMLGRGFNRQFYLDVVAGWEFNLAVVAGGDIKCWGRWINGQCFVPRHEQNTPGGYLRSKNVEIDLLNKIFKKLIVD